MELCRWDSIPERLWKGETNQSAEEFMKDHEEYFVNPSPAFEFVAYYFEKYRLVPRNNPPFPIIDSGSTYHRPNVLFSGGALRDFRNDDEKAFVLARE